MSSEGQEILEFLRNCNRWLQDEGVLQGSASEPRFDEAADEIESLRRAVKAMAREIEELKRGVAA